MMKYATIEYTCGCLWEESDEPAKGILHYCGLHHDTKMPTIEMAYGIWVLLRHLDIKEASL